MTISGFTMVKNAGKLYYPVKESILSILPLVDEFIVALGDCDSDDRTREIIHSIGNSKIKIIDTVWDVKKFPEGTENAHQTDIAKSYCTGDWLFYLQADEVVHEESLPVIYDRCSYLNKDNSVEGLLFDYLHFWGDYRHYHNSHKWYRREIRMVRNHPEIHSWIDAQSFRRIPGFDGFSYRQVKNTFKLNVAHSGVSVYHYGWVRPPSVMRKKSISMDTMYQGEEKVSKMKEHRSVSFDYGPLNRLPEFNGKHPEVMKEWISGFSWKNELQYNGKPSRDRALHNHERMKFRMLTWIEGNILRGGRLGEFRNYKLLRR
jgi:hypothetical protein